jgi:hypothetical protein
MDRKPPPLPNLHEDLPTSLVTSRPPARNKCCSGLTRLDDADACQLAFRTGAAIGTRGQGTGKPAVRRSARRYVAPWDRVDGKRVLHVGAQGEGGHSAALRPGPLRRRALDRREVDSANCGSALAVQHVTCRVPDRGSVGDFCRLKYSSGVDSLALLIRWSQFESCRARRS